VREHGEKIKDMAESVLPSKARRSARTSRRRAHHRHRAHERDLLVAIRRGRDDDADFGERRRHQDIDTMVLARRFADKTGSLVRWAASQVDRDDSLREASLDEQREYFARLLPDNLIGRHAVQHIESALRHRGRPDYWQVQKTEKTDRLRRERAQLTADLRVILAAGRHRELNEALRAGYLWQAGVRPCGARPTVPTGAVGRLLLGAHDVDDFVAAVAGHHPWVPGTVRDVAREAGQRGETAG